MAALSRDRAISCGLDDPGEGVNVVEDNASGNELIIADADGLGRSIVLICQDIQTLPFAQEVVRQFQPDWVFVPVLDFEAGLMDGRWVHQRTFELSALSQARFIVCNSTALADRLNKLDKCYCGLAVGPKECAGLATLSTLDKNRAFQNVKPIAGTTPAYATVTWRGSGWKTTLLGAG